MTALRARCLMALALALHIGALAAPAPHRPSVFEEQVDTLVREGFERPGQALAALETMLAGFAASSDEQRTLLLAMGSIEARTGGVARAGAIAERL
ncbi:MAG: hypothetical protein H7Y61_00555, partial [Rhizobiales bacterium]|nr:hypothetical protein [Rhizobacter sp.]